MKFNAMPSLANRVRPLCFLSIIFTLATACHGITFQSFRAQPFDEGYPYPETRPIAISADGRVILGETVMFWRGSLHHEAFRWTASEGIKHLAWSTSEGIFHPGRLPLHPLYTEGDPYNAVYSQASGISGDGSVVVGNSNFRGYRWTAEGGMTPFLPLDDPGWFFPSAVSADGQVTVGRGELDGQLGLYMLKGDNPATLIRLGEGFDVVGISHDGSTIFGNLNISSAEQQAFRWTEAEGFVALGNMVASRVSGDGSVVTGWSRSDAEIPPQPVRWTLEQGMVPIDPSDRFGSVSERNLLDALTGAGIDMGGWVLWDITGISADRRTIMGAGRVRDSDVEPWREEIWVVNDYDPFSALQPVPEPSTYGLIGASILLLIAIRRSSFLSRSAGEKGSARKVW